MGWHQPELEIQYEQATEYVANSIESMLESYNSVSKMPYYYNVSSYGSTYTSYMSFDNFRKIVYGEIYSEETMQQRRRSDMENFLQYLGNLDSSIICLHFIAEDLTGEKLDFHKAMDGTYFNNEPLFEQLVGYSALDRGSNKLILIPPHDSTYKNSIDRKVFSIARNYYDLRGNVGKCPDIFSLRTGFRRQYWMFPARFMGTRFRWSGSRMSGTRWSMRLLTAAPACLTNVFRFLPHLSARLPMGNGRMPAFITVRQ